MVVLEDSGSMSVNPNQYLQPDYLSPLSSSMDSKKSPLALLAQTCSQIGTDNTPTKPLLPPPDKKKLVNSVNSETVSRISPNQTGKNDKFRSTPDTKHLAFKPYETNVISKKEEEIRPLSKGSSESCDEKKSGKSTPGRKSTSPVSGKIEMLNDQKSSIESSSTSPIIRAGLEVLGNGKDQISVFKNLHGLSTFNPLGGIYCAPGMEHHNPAFRPSYAGAAFSPHHAAILAAAVGFPVTTNPYIGYNRMKPSTDSETMIPVCKDPYCTGCQLSTNNHHLLVNNGVCPAGCTQCEHQKYNLAMTLSQQAGAMANLPYHQLGRSYVCNWIVGDTYCGKRFITSDELLHHLRSHTTDSAILTSISSMPPSILNPLNPLFTTSGLRGPFPTAPLSAMPANRYHPYSKTSVPTTATSSYAIFNPAGAFYSPYGIYSQRTGAAVHQ